MFRKKIVCKLNKVQASITLNLLHLLFPFFHIFFIQLTWNVDFWRIEENLRMTFDFQWIFSNGVVWEMVLLNDFDSTYLHQQRSIGGSSSNSSFQYVTSIVGWIEWRDSFYLFVYEKVWDCAFSKQHNQFSEEAIPRNHFRLILYHGSKCANFNALSLAIASFLPSPK